LSRTLGLVEISPAVIQTCFVLYFSLEPFISLKITTGLFSFFLQSLFCVLKASVLSLNSF
jgi:hypothetical protein